MKGHRWFLFLGVNVFAEPQICRRGKYKAMLQFPRPCWWWPLFQITDWLWLLSFGLQVIDASIETIHLLILKIARRRTKRMPVVHVTFVVVVVAGGCSRHHRSAIE